MDDSSRPDRLPADDGAASCYAIHDGLINEWGIKVLESVLNSEAERLGADIRRLKPGESVELCDRQATMPGRQA